ncbi:AraC family transcriptional regulator [Burkholderia sp. KK1]|nr:AraC family transcriptional regulator [Burkholderia sp. KK1]
MTDMNHPNLPPAAFPVACVVRHGKTAHAGAHSHACGQLIYPQLGGVLLETGNSLIRLAPDRAAWIPEGVSHGIAIDRSFRYYSLYISRELLQRDETCVLPVRPLMRELILDASQWASESSDVATAKALVLVDEIQRAQSIDSAVRIPDDPRIENICRTLEQNPGSAKTLDDWADEAGISSKTLQRYFVSATGMSFQQWRNRVRMAKAVELHAGGLRIIDVAMTVGYSTEGAYAQAFRKFYGYPPSRLRLDGASITRPRPQP